MRRDIRKYKRIKLLKDVFRILFYLWCTIGIMILILDLISYTEMIIKGKDEFKVFKRDDNIGALHLLITVPFLYLFILKIKEEIRRIQFKKLY